VILDRLEGVIPAFFMIFVSSPVKMTTPMTQSVFFKLHPLNNRFSMLIGSALISGSESSESRAYHFATPLYAYKFGAGPSDSIQNEAASQSWADRMADPARRA
jgi:hypothetical protein